MKHIIYKKENNEPTIKLSSYEGPKDDSSQNRSYLHAEPLAIHLLLPEGIDEDCAVPVWGEISPAYNLTLREPIPAVPAQPAIVENGVEIQPAQAEIPVVDGLYQTVPAVLGWKLVEDASLKLAKRQKKANDNLDTIRKLREPLLKEADIEINTKEDNSQDASNVRAWRKALRECTDSLKKTSGDAKLSVESLVPSEFTFPSKG